MRPQRAVQRAAASGPSADTGPLDAGPGPAAPVTAHPSSVRVDRSSAGAAAASELRANAFTSGDTIVLPSVHGPLDRGRGRSLLAHELVHVNQQRRLGGELPHEASAAGQQLELQARSAERAVEGLPEPRLSSAPLGLPLGSSRRVPASDVAPATGGSDRDVHQAIDAALVLTADGGRHGAGPGAPTTSNGHAPQASTDEPISLPQRQDASVSPATPAPASGGAASDAELDELARRLYERIRHRLGRELLLDRERSGLLADPR